MKLLKVEEIKPNNVLEIKYENDKGEEKIIISNDLDLKNDFDKICDIIRSDDAIQTIVDDSEARKVVREEVSSLTNKSFSLVKEEKEKVK
jgi:hypothetical protein